MSVHTSLRLNSGATATARSVWTRRERLEKLIASGRRAEEGSPLGLPKVRTMAKVIAKKKKEAAPTPDAAAAKAAE